MTEPCRLRVLSLGAGVQSTTLALMAAAGEIEPMPDCAIFADTQSEPAAVYEHLRWLMGPDVLPFPVHVVSTGNLGDAILQATRGQNNRGSHARPPVYVLNADGSRGILRRQCTGDYKIDPIQAKLRELLGLKPRQRWPKAPIVEQWIGISTDEAHRMKPIDISAIEPRWPLIEKRMSRWACLLWLERHGYPEPPKSACVFCPFQSDRRWRHLQDTDPDGFARAVEIDAEIRNGLRSDSLTGQLFLHRSLRPLDEVDLRNDNERGQPDLFGSECDGVCGV
jgi:hypothetical protein